MTARQRSTQPRPASIKPGHAHAAARAGLALAFVLFVHAAGGALAQGPPSCGVKFGTASSPTARFLNMSSFEGKFKLRAPSTLEFWINLHSIPEYDAGLLNFKDKHDDNVNNLSPHELVLYFSKNATDSTPFLSLWRYSAQYLSATAWRMYMFSSGIPLSKWVHIAIVFGAPVPATFQLSGNTISGNEGSPVSIYLNGEAQGLSGPAGYAYGTYAPIVTDPPGSFVNNTPGANAKAGTGILQAESIDFRKNFIGANLGNTDYTTFSNASIADLRWWRNKALTQAEVQNVYQNGLACETYNPDDFYFYYKFDETSSNTASDSSSFGLKATLNGDVSFTCTSTRPACTPTPSPSPTPSATPSATPSGSSPSPTAEAAPAAGAPEPTPTLNSAAAVDAPTPTPPLAVAGAGAVTAATPTPVPSPAPAAVSGVPPYGGTCVAGPSSVKAAVEPATVNCSGWRTGSPRLVYSIFSDLSTDLLVSSSLEPSMAFYFPSLSDTTQSAKLTVKIADSKGLSTTFSLPSPIEVTPLVPPSSGTDAFERFQSLIAVFNEQLKIIVDSTEAFGTKMKRIVALVNTLKTDYFKLTGTALRHLARRALLQTSAATDALSGALTNVMTTVNNEATKAGVDLKDTETAGALVSFFASVAPLAAKTGALKEADAVKGASLLMSVIQANPSIATTAGIDSAGLQASLAGLLAAIPATSTSEAATAIRSQTQKALSSVSTQITLKSGNASCTAQPRSSSLEPLRFKVCTKTDTKSLSLSIPSSGTGPAAQVRFPSDAASGDFQVAVNTPPASAFGVTSSACSVLASPIYEVTATAFADDGSVVNLQSFKSKITFELPLNSACVTSAGQTVSLVYFDEASRAWKECDKATSSSGAVYAATCDHLTAFAMKVSNPATVSVPYWSAAGALSASSLLSAVLASAAAAAALLLAKY